MIEKAFVSKSLGQFELEMTLLFHCSSRLEGGLQCQVIFVFYSFGLFLGFILSGSNMNN